MRRGSGNSLRGIDELWSNAKIEVVCIYQVPFRMKVSTWEKLYPNLLSFSNINLYSASLTIRIKLQGAHNSDQIKIPNQVFTIPATIIKYKVQYFYD